MRYPAERNADAGQLCHRDRTKALLAAAVEHHLAGQGCPPNQTGLSPWDVWWVCYRAQHTAAEFCLDPWRAAGPCAHCATDAGMLAFRVPPTYPDGMSVRNCSCLLDWARSMREPMSGIAWPQWRLTMAMVKPDSDAIRARELLAESHQVLTEFQRHLTSSDVRRLYPDAYGRTYVARRDAYLTSAPVTVFVLLASPSATGRAIDIKSAIRRRLGDGHVLRNHLHMPDSPGDAFV